MCAPKSSEMFVCEFVFIQRSCHVRRRNKFVVNAPCRKPSMFTCDGGPRLVCLPPETRSLLLSAEAEDVRGIARLHLRTFTPRSQDFLFGNSQNVHIYDENETLTNFTGFWTVLVELLVRLLVAFPTAA